MARTEKKGRRGGFTSWFVEPYKQVKLGLVLLLVNFVFSALILGIMGYYLWDIYSTMAAYFELTADQGTQMMSKLIVPAAVVVGLIVLFIATTILISVKYTYRIYGPLVSIHRFLDDLLAGKTATALILRESDQLLDLARKLNLLSERLHGDKRGTALVAIHRYLDQIIKGDKPEPLSLRDNDTFKDLADKINKLVVMKKP
ncbi:MAG: hypothetical protein AB7T49_20590 [Oligoflexales bacterium]